MGGWRKILNFNGITEIFVVQNSAQRWSAPKEGAWKETNCNDQVAENERGKKKIFVATKLPKWLGRESGKRENKNYGTRIINTLKPYVAYRK